MESGIARDHCLMQAFLRLTWSHECSGYLEHLASMLLCEYYFKHYFSQGVFSPELLW